MVIRYPGSFDGQPAPDGAGRGAMEAAVTHALASAFDLDASQIAVSSIGSYVILSGFVQSSRERLRAEEIAADIAGADYVRSRLLHRSQP